MKQQFISKNFSAASLEIIQQANSIINEMDAKGYSLTLRQLYYQFVARDFLANNQRNYNRLGRIINSARLAGYVDWDAIEDRTRFVRRVSFWSSPAEIIEAAVRSYRIDYWKNQPTYIEFWIEKDALIDIVQKVCNQYGVPCFSCRGYVSQTAMKDAADRIDYRMSHIYYGDEGIVYHFGDHDPSGIDMTRDIEERLNMFSPSPIRVKRLALNIDQIQKYNPPPNPAKMTDTRVGDYLSKYGRESWELDALDPDVIADLIEKTIKKNIDEDAWEDMRKQEDREKYLLQQAADNLREELDE